MAIKRSDRFKGKKVLITAGPTWVAIDPVRVISNLATGETGILLAKKLAQQGAKVTLLLGPANGLGFVFGIKVIRFKYFSELKQKISQELARGSFDIMIHSAAVSDFMPKTVSRKKFSSEKKSLKLELVSTPKIIDGLKTRHPEIVLVGFKFDPEGRKAALLKQAGRLLEKSHADLVVANSMVGPCGYLAFILDKGSKLSGPFCDKHKMIEGLLERLEK